MKSSYIFNHEHYHSALKSQLHSRVISQYSRQRGGGIGGIIGTMSQYVIPVAKNYVLPEVKNAAIRTVGDVIQGTPIPAALITNTKNLIQNVARNIAQSKSQQGGSISRKRKSVVYKPVVKTKKNKQTVKQKSKLVKKKCNKKCKTKRDIFG